MTPLPDKPRARDRAYAEVRRRILNYSLPPGVPVSENELAAELGVSRTPAREALLMLAGEGFVRIEPKVGSFVTRLRRDEILEAQFLREAVECASLGSLKHPLDEAMVDKLRDNIRRQRAEPKTVTEFTILDDEFHRGLMQLAGHAGSWQAVARAKGHLDRARHVTPTTRTAQSTLVQQHAAVLEAVKNNDIDDAVQLLRSHLRIVLRDIELLAQAQPEMFA